MQRKLCAAIFLLALGVRLTLLFGFRRVEFTRAETIKIALSIAQRGAFADPYIVPTGPTAHTGPLYPAVSAPFYMVFGDTEAADMARFAFNAIAASAGYALMPAVAEALGMGWAGGAIAGLLGALIPLHYWVECANDSESSWTALFVGLAVLWFARFLARPRPSTGSAARAGLFWGAGILLSPTVAPILAALLALAAWWRRIERRWLGVVALTTVAVLAPWTIRNAVRLGGFCFVRDDFPLELFVSNHDGATPLADLNYFRPYWKTAHPDSSVEAALEIRRIGELPFERKKRRQAVEWIGRNPRRFASLTAARWLRFWFPAVPRAAWAFWVVTVLAGAGWVLLFRRVRRAAVILFAVLAAYSAPFYLVQFTLRYEHPIWWALVLLAAWPLSLPFASRYSRTARATSE
jgi:hypothetical protein